MRKTIALLALAGIFALSAIAFGSPPTQTKKTFKKIQIVKTDTVNTAADTSAVATRDAEARTCEAADAQALNSNELITAKSDYAVSVTRQGFSPSERLPSGNAESRATNRSNLYERAEAGSPSGYVLRL